jgi:membrane-associated protease RseP (regulator of RpoE activity)
MNFMSGLLVLFGIAIKNLGFIEGIKNTIIMIYQTTISFCVGIYLLCTGQVIMTKASEVNQLMSNLSMEYILAYFAIFSILMGIINIFPFPSLDGSLPFLWIIEKLTGGKASKVLQYVWFIGFILLMILQVVVLYFWIF